MLILVLFSFHCFLLVFFMQSSNVLFDFFLIRFITTYNRKVLLQVNPVCFHCFFVQFFSISAILQVWYQFILQFHPKRLRFPPSYHTAIYSNRIFFTITFIFLKQINVFPQFKQANSALIICSSWYKQIISIQFFSKRPEVFYSAPSVPYCWDLLYPS